MTVDFVVGRAPRYRIATRTLVGSWPGDRKLQAEYLKLTKWSSRMGLKTGSWFFRESGSSRRGRKWEVGVEVKGKGALKGGRGVSLKELPATSVVSLTFDPAVISPMLAYSGLDGWLRWMSKEGKYKIAGRYREVYPGNPWKSKSAWAHTKVEVPVRRS